MASNDITGKKAKSIVLDEAAQMGKPDAFDSLGNMLELKTFDAEEFAKGGMVVGYDRAAGGDTSVLAMVNSKIPMQPKRHHEAFVSDKHGNHEKIGEVKSIDYTYDIETVAIADPKAWKADWSDLELKIAADLKSYQEDAYRKMLMGDFYGGMTSNVAPDKTPESPTLKELYGLMEKHAYKPKGYAHRGHRAFTPHRLAGDPIPLTPPELSHPDNLKQALYDRVLMGMRKQRCKAVLVEGGQVITCQYRSRSGARCAVGMMIPDARYHASLEGRVSYEVAYAAGIPADMIRPDMMEFMQGIQRDLHDRIPAGEDFMYIFELAAENFAFKNNLTYRPPGTRWAAPVQFAASFAPPSENNTAFKDTHEIREF